MITEQQYREAQEIVDAWNEQEYQKQIEQIKILFPLGCVIKNKITKRKGWVQGYSTNTKGPLLLIDSDRYKGYYLLAANAIKL